MRPQDFHWRPETFHWRPQIFVWDFQIFIGDPRFSKETPSFTFRLQIFFADPQIFIRDLTQFIGDPRFSLETSIFSLENPGIFSETPRFLRWKVLVLIENIWGPSIKILRSPMKIGGLKQKFRVSNENLGDHQSKSECLQRKSGVFNEFCGVS